MHPCWDGLWRGGPKGLVGASKYWMAFGGVVQRALLVHPSIGWPLEGWSKGLGSCIQVLDGLWGGDPKDHDSASKYWMALGLMDQRRGFEASKYWIAHPRQPRPTQGNPSPPKATQAHPRQPKPTRGDPSQPKATQANTYMITQYDNFSINIEVYPTVSKAKYPEIQDEYVQNTSCTPSTMGSTSIVAVCSGRITRSSLTR
jgi:hypothetical protein